METLKLSNILDYLPEKNRSIKRLIDSGIIAVFGLSPIKDIMYYDISDSFYMLLLTYPDVLINVINTNEDSTFKNVIFKFINSPQFYQLQYIK